MASSPIMVKSNILDPIEQGLDPTVFDDPTSPQPKLKEVHRKWLIKTVYDALSHHGYEHPERWLHLILTGSLTTYQYSADSDVDISLFVAVEKLPEWSRAEMIGIMIDNFDGQTMPGTSHVVQGFVVSPKIKVEVQFQPGLRSGYDLDSERWIVPPERSRVHDVEREMNGSYVYALESADKMERLLQYEPAKAIQFWHQIHKRRQRDQIRGKGDYSESNIVYKFLHNRGLFPKISEVSGEYIGKMGATTRKQQLEYAQQLDQQIGPDQSKVVHQWPDGWTMRELQTYGDAQREGEQMGNCFAIGDLEPDSWHQIWRGHPDVYGKELGQEPRPMNDIDPDSKHELWGFPDEKYPPRYDVPLPQGMWSLRDPDNLPHVSIDHENYLGRHNDEPKPEYRERVDEFLRAKRPWG